jgi:hypothetical protein
MKSIVRLNNSGFKKIININNAIKPNRILKLARIRRSLPVISIIGFLSINPSGT